MFISTDIGIEMSIIDAYMSDIAFYLMDIDCIKKGYLKLNQIPFYFIKPKLII